MKRYEDSRWRESMSITVDWGSMMEPESGADPRHTAAVSSAEIDKIRPRIQRVQNAIASKWGRASRGMAWTKLPFGQKKTVDDLLRTAARVRKNFDTLVVVGTGCGMYGIRAVHQALHHSHYNELSAQNRGGPRLYIVDSTDPEAVQNLLDVIDLRTTCFHVLSGAVTAPETMALYALILRSLQDSVGEGWNRHLIITSESKDAELVPAAQYYRCKIFCLPEGVRGAFAALSPAGLLSAAVCGVDIEELLAGAAQMLERCAEQDWQANPGFMAGLLSYLLQKKGVSLEAVLPYGESLYAAADWYADLCASALSRNASAKGKPLHTGINPVTVYGAADRSGRMRLVTSGTQDKAVTVLASEEFRTRMDIPFARKEGALQKYTGSSLNAVMRCEIDAACLAMKEAGCPYETVILPRVNAFTLGQLMSFWMVKTAVAAEFLGIDAYEAPDPAQDAYIRRFLETESGKGDTLAE